MCSVMLATYKNYKYFFLFESAVCQVALCLLDTILPYCDRAGSFRKFSLNFSITFYAKIASSS